MEAPPTPQEILEYKPEMLHQQGQQYHSLVREEATQEVAEAGTQKAEGELIREVPEELTLEEVGEPTQEVPEEVEAAAEVVEVV